MPSGFHCGQVFLGPLSVWRCPQNISFTGFAKPAPTALVQFFFLGRAADTPSDTVSTWYTSSLSSLQAPAHSAGRGGLGRKYYPCVLEALTIQLSLETSELSTQARSISQRALNARGGLFHTGHENELEDEDDEDDSGALRN